MAKITLATIKRFIKANRAALHICTQSRFDGMTDGVEQCRDQPFRLAVAPDYSGRAFKASEYDRDNRLGIAGAWFVFESRDSFTAYDDGKFAGFRVYNCCGSFVLAIPKVSDVARMIAAAQAPDYEARVQAYEAQGMTRSDAQGMVDAEDMQRVAA